MSGPREPADLSARELAGAIGRRELSCTEALESCLRRVDERDGELGAIVWRDDEETLSAARRADQQVAHSRPEDLPPFLGVPIPVKDLTLVEGWPVTFGSRGATPGHRPRPAWSTPPPPTPCSASPGGWWRGGARSSTC